LVWIPKQRIAGARPSIEAPGLARQAATQVNGAGGVGTGIIEDPQEGLLDLHSQAVATKPNPPPVRNNTLITPQHYHLRAFRSKGDLLHFIL